MNEVCIRSYKREDRQYIREICYATAFRGESGDFFFDDKEILSDIVTLYYTEYEPESIFVAEVKQNIVGYLTGCKDTKRYYYIWMRKILIPLIIKALFRGVIFNIKNLKFLYYTALSYMKKEFKKPVDIYKKYPAHFHINLIKDYRGKGIGSRLVYNFLDYLKRNNIKGLHIVTASEKAKRFFEKCGFNLIYFQKISSLRFLLKEDILLYTLARLI